MLEPSTKIGHQAQRSQADGKCPTDPTDKPCICPPGTETGMNKPGIAIVFAPVNLAAEVKSVRTKKPCWTMPKMCPSRNCVVDTSPVIGLNYPGQISNGYTPVLHCNTAHIACEFSEIKEKVFRLPSKSRWAVARIAGGSDHDLAAGGLSVSKSQRSASTRKS
ncbi:elongation factor-1 alpha [Culex quinquefasciatus]|uniref:Elongation factor-1 alpha n=1 Tax=Culex quinquefasciatus TaxID=7176 RepID=B0WBP2_CULQU|nr:elongation factor-1 alpha [Culex quinquefasciatus]|eukprot:XP_001846126.1 elongation factor-1 alpha [Culex quinquefasciatus]